MKIKYLDKTSYKEESCFIDFLKKIEITLLLLPKKSDKKPGVYTLFS
jgi:hypothetical protein